MIQDNRDVSVGSEIPPKLTRNQSWINTGKLKATVELSNSSQLIGKTIPLPQHRKRNSIHQTNSPQVLLVF